MSDVSNIDNSANVSDAHIPNTGATVPDAAATPADSAPAPTDASQAPADEPKATPQASIQKSINRLTRQRAEAERRAIRAEAELDAVRRHTQSTPPAKSAEPKQSDFATYEDFVAHRAGTAAREAARAEVATEREAQAQREAQQQAARRHDSFHTEASTQATAAGIDWEETWEELTSQPFVSEPVAAYLMDAENKATLGDWLAKNPGEIARISALHPIAAVRELAKVEARIGSKPAPRTTNTPPPPPTVNGRSTPQFDPEKASMEEYAAWRSKQEA